MIGLSPQIRKIRMINELICEHAERIRYMIEEIELGHCSESAVFPEILGSVFNISKNAWDLGHAAKINDYLNSVKKPRD